MLPAMPEKSPPIEDDIRRLAGASAADIVAWGLARFGRKLAIASSFSIEDCVVIDLACKAARAAKSDDVRVFALDTGRLPDETYMTAERVRMKYGVEIEWLFPQREPVEQLVKLKGLYSFRDSLENRHECCGIRKVEPLAARSRRSTRGPPDCATSSRSRAPTRRRSSATTPTAAS